MGHRPGGAGLSRREAERDEGNDGRDGPATIAGGRPISPTAPPGRRRRGVFPTGWRWTPRSTAPASPHARQVRHEGSRWRTCPTAPSSCTRGRAHLVLGAPSCPSPGGIRPDRCPALRRRVTILTPAPQRRGPAPRLPPGSASFRHTTALNPVNHAIGDGRAMMRPDRPVLVLHPLGRTACTPLARAVHAQSHGHRHRRRLLAPGHHRRGGAKASDDRAVSSSCGSRTGTALIAEVGQAPSQRTGPSAHGQRMAEGRGIAVSPRHAVGAILHPTAASAAASAQASFVLSRDAFDAGPARGPSAPR
jgi:hypothetical protein